jgi:hypothetical protein
LQFRPPRDGPAVSTLLRDYATAEEIGVVVAALQQLRRKSQRAGAGRRMSAAAQDAALAAMWAAADRRRIGWILEYLRNGIVHRDYRDYAGLLPEGSARGLLPQFCPVRARITALWGIYAVCPSSRIDKYRGTMRFREERIDFAPLPVECQRMCACFGWHHLLAAHCGNIDDIYYPRVADGHVKVRGLRMQENHVRGAAEGDVPEHATRRCVNREQCASIAGAK